MLISAVRIFVHDIDAAKRFYGGTLGLPVAWDQDGTIGYECGATLIIEHDYGEHEGLVGRFTAVSFEVYDIAATIASMTAKGGEFLGPPELFPGKPQRSHT